jgi:hypothetical protein
MALLGLLVLAALMIPVVVVLVDSPIGRAIARRLEGPDATPPALAEMAKKIEVLEGEVDELSRSVDTLRDENRFLQKLIEEGPRRSSLPPGPAS